MNRLRLPQKSSNSLILQPADQNSNSPKMAYLIRQLFENKLRKKIDEWHGTPFSTTIPQNIQCQLEVNQEYYEWNDSIDMLPSIGTSRCSSPTLSTQSVYSNRITSNPWHSSGASITGCTQNLSRRLTIAEQANERNPS